MVSLLLADWVDWMLILLLKYMDGWIYYVRVAHLAGLIWVSVAIFISFGVLRI